MHDDAAIQPLPLPLTLKPSWFSVNLTKSKPFRNHFGRLIGLWAQSLKMHTFGTGLQTDKRMPKPIPKARAVVSKTAKVEQKTKKGLSILRSKSHQFSDDRPGLKPKMGSRFYCNRLFDRLI